MADYKKKSKRMLGSAPKRRIEPKAKRATHSKSHIRKPSYTDGDLKVVKGRKLEQQRRFRVGAIIVFVIVLALVITQLSLPIGIMDTTENIFARVGTGSFPIALNGTDLVDVKSTSGYFLTLSDSSLSAYNNSGKEIFSFVHGFENPIIKRSSTRVLIFEQGGSNYSIYNLSEQKSKKKVEGEIIAANISRNGTYALVTSSEQYAAAVSVYDRNDNLLYEWYSAEDIVNNVGISPNGKKLAVSTINAKGGKFLSKILVFEYDSATPVFSKEIENSVVYSIETTHNRGFWYTSENITGFIKWSKFSEQQHSTDYSLSHFKADTSGAVAVFNRHNDQTDNHIVVFSKSGKKKKEFDFKGKITDISFTDGHIYCIGDSNISMLSTSGEALKAAECEFGSERLSVLSAYYVAAIGDNEIQKIHLE